MGERAFVGREIGYGRRLSARSLAMILALLAIKRIPLAMIGLLLAVIESPLATSDFMETKNKPAGKSDGCVWYLISLQL